MAAAWAALGGEEDLRGGETSAGGRRERERRALLISAKTSTALLLVAWALWSDEQGRRLLERLARKDCSMGSADSRI